MTIPANLDAESARWGSTPVTPVYGAQGGPYTVVGNGNGLPVQGAVAAGSSGSSVNPVLNGVLDSSSNIQALLGHQDLTLLSSAARTATTSSAGQVSVNAQGVIIYFNVTVASGTGGVMFQIQTQDPVSGSWVTACVGANLTTTGMRAYIVRNGVFSPGSYTNYFNIVPARSWRVNIVHGDGSSYTYSVGATLLM